MEDGRAAAAGPCAWKEDGVVNRCRCCTKMERWWRRCRCVMNSWWWLQHFVVLPWWIVLVHFSCKSGAVSLAEMKKWWICLRGGCTAKKMEAVWMEDASLWWCCANWCTNVSAATMVSLRREDDSRWWLQPWCGGALVQVMAAVVGRCKVAVVQVLWTNGSGDGVAGSLLLDAWNRGGRQQDWRLGWRLPWWWKEMMKIRVRVSCVRWRRWWRGSV